MKLYKKKKNKEIIIIDLMYNKFSEKDKNNYILITNKEQAESISRLTIPGFRYER